MSRPRAQRRLVDAQHAQAVVQVGTEPPRLHRGLEIDVGRRHDPHVHRNRRVPAEPLDRAFLQEAQQARLALERHVADFVEKQRAAVRGLDPADLALVRARECTALVAEQFGLQQRRRNGRAVHGDEGRVGAQRLLVDRRRRQLLAGAGFAGDEDGGVRVRDLADRREQPAHGVARADHRAAGARHRRPGCRPRASASRMHGRPDSRSSYRRSHCARSRSSSGESGARW